MAQTVAQTDRFGVPLQGWSLAAEYPHDDGCGLVVTVACDTCGDGFVTDDPDTDTTCAVCLMPPAEVAALRAMVPAPIRPAPVACLFCGDPMYGTDGDGTRHPRCARFVASLDARRFTRKEEPIAA